jgi:hypothetical protein
MDSDVEVGSVEILNPKSENLNKIKVIISLLTYEHLSRPEVNINEEGRNEKS